MGNIEIIINFEPISRRIYINTIDTIYQYLINTDIKIRSECGGKGTCGKCRILIQEGREFLNNPTMNEINKISEKLLQNGWRLACQCKVNEKKIQKLNNSDSPKISVYLPEDLLIDDFNILISGLDKGVRLNPAIKKIFVRIHQPSLNHPIADLERIISELLKKNNNLKKNLKIEYNLLKRLPNLLNKGNNELTLTIWNEKRIIDLEIGDNESENFGIAFDIGTTTLVGYLINLNNKKIYSVGSRLNPQTQYGEDVISRITYIKENKNGLKVLQSILLEAMNKIILKTCEKAKIIPNQIYETTIVGNSVMHHIFLGINPVQIGMSPYNPVIQKGLDLKAKNINLETSKNGNIYTLPLISGFVGADTMGVILSSKIYKEKKITLIIDIGTNGEIIIGNKDILLAGSCAAGPALEGAHIKHGMRAAAGAIDTVRIEPESLNIKYTTIKNKSPIGICGSGLIDIIAEMLKAKIITRSGIFNKEFTNHNRFLKVKNDIEFIIAYRDETLLNNDITISLEDIRQVQMAKAAFYSGINIIMNHLNKESDKKILKIEQIFLAGAFGNYINKINARFIGMIPDIELDKIFQIGNAAGIGAQYCLINKNLRKKANYISNKIKYIEIGMDNKFQKEYAKAMYFPHINLELFPSLRLYQNIPKR